MTDPNTYERQLSLLLRRTLELEKDRLMSEVHELVNEHFANITKDNLLSSSQLKNLENVAFTSLSPSEVEKFISKQASKDSKRKAEKTWVYRELDKKLLDQVKKITSETAKNVIDAVKEKARRIPDLQTVDWFTPEREQDIKITLLREFISQFAVIYGLKAAEQPGVESELTEDYR